MRPRRLRRMTAAAMQRRRAAFYVLVHQHEHEPDEYFIDPAARLYDDMVVALPPLPPRRAARFRDQLELWPVHVALPMRAPAIALSA